MDKHNNLKLMLQNVEHPVTVLLGGDKISITSRYVMLPSIVPSWMTLRTSCFTAAATALSAYVTWVIWRRLSLRLPSSVRTVSVSTPLPV